MAILIFGHRDYGRVEAHGGEYAATRFFHVYFVPLVPTSSRWIVGHTADGTLGHPIAMHGKSVAAAYLRVGGPVLAVGTLGAGAELGSVGLMIASAIPAALSAWSWTWRTLRPGAAHRRSDFNGAAFGTRCEARHMFPPLRAELKQRLDAEWIARKPNKSPNDVGVHGAADAAEAVIAYGLLRLAAVQRGKAGAEEDAGADQILAGRLEPTPFGDSPYRVAAPVAPDAPPHETLGASPAPVGAFVAVRGADAPARGVARSRTDRNRAYNQRLGLILLTLCGLGGLALFIASFAPPVELSRADLMARASIGHDDVRITCDALAQVWEIGDERGEVVHRISLCVLGAQALPVKVGPHMPDIEVPIVVHGVLQPLPTEERWVTEGLRVAPKLEGRLVAGYVDATGASDPPSRVIGFAVALAMPLGWLLYLRSRRRARRAARAATT